MEELSSPLKNDRIDLIFMNDAAPVINFEIIRPNAPLFVSNEDLKLDVEQRTCQGTLTENTTKTF